jgi:hypothetical protein
MERFDHESQKLIRMLHTKRAETLDKLDDLYKLSVASAVVDGNSRFSISNVAEAAQYVSSSTPCPWGFDTPYDGLELYNRKRQVFDAAGLYLAPLDRLRWRDMTPEQLGLARRNIDPHGYLDDGMFQVVVEREAQWWTLDCKRLLEPDKTEDVLAKLLEPPSEEYLASRRAA